MKIIGLVSNTILPAILICGVSTIPFNAGAASKGEEGAIILCPHLPADIAEIPLCNNQQATCVGTEGHDLIWGTDASDVIYAGAGNDVIQGDAEDDIICGGDGNDAIHGARGDDTLFGDRGSDFLFGARDNDTLYGGEGDFDVLYGGPGIDRLNGGPGNYDVCLTQREGGDVDEKSCETIYPPPGYKHDDEHLEPGVIGPR
ncbi:MAG: calcium-binding protein [Pseudomonadota bacterium]